MTWRDIKTSDDRDMYAWEQEQEAMLMAEIARDIWKDPVAQRAWIKQANYYLTLRNPHTDTCHLHSIP